MPDEGRENPLLKKGNSDAFFREKYLTKNTRPELTDVQKGMTVFPVKSLASTKVLTGHVAIPHHTGYLTGGHLPQPLI